MNIPYLISKQRSAIMGIAILWIMLFHAPVELNDLILMFIKGIGYGGVDVFLFLSGFGLYFSLSKKSVNLRNWYWNRFVRILPEFWLYLFVAWFVAMDYSIKSFFELLLCATTLGYWIPIIPYKLWYISSILFFYAIYPLIFHCYKKRGVIVPIVAIGIGLTVILLYAIVMLFVFDNRNVGGLLILTISRIPIFFIGSIFGRWAKNNSMINVSPKNVMIAFLLSFVAVFSLYYSRMHFTPYLSTCSLNFLPFIIITPVFCTFFAVVFEKIPNILAKCFSYIGQISLELFITHVYFYQTFFNMLSYKYGSTSSFIILTCASFMSAIILYYVNKLYLQKLFASIRK